MAPKINFWRAFWDAFLAPSFFMYFISIFMLFFKSRPSKFIGPRSVSCTCAIFDFIAKCIEIWSKKRWILRSKIEENRCKNALKKQAFFNIEFSLIFRGFRPRFGRSQGGFGEHLAVQNKSLKGTINFFDKIAIFKGFGEGLGRVLGGSWEGLEGGWGEFWEGLRAFWALQGLNWTLLGFASLCWAWLAFARLCWGVAPCWKLWALAVARFNNFQTFSLFPFLAKTGFQNLKLAQNLQ